MGSIGSPPFRKTPLHFRLRFCVQSSYNRPDKICIAPPDTGHFTSFTPLILIYCLVSLLTPPPLHTVILSVRPTVFVKEAQVPLR